MAKRQLWATAPQPSRTDRKRLEPRAWRVCLLALGCILAQAAPSRAAVRLPALVGDNMVLQQGRTVAIWGRADAGEQVTVSFRDQKQTAVANTNGRWKVELAPMQPGGPWDMTITASNTLTLHNILVGEVWVCSGQSNMEMPVGLNPQGWSAGVNNFEQEIADSTNPSLRLFNVQKTVAGKPQTNVVGAWAAASPQSVAPFSATAYFFGRDLQRALKEPVGLIASSFGGSPVEAWMSASAIAADPALTALDDAWKEKITDFPYEVARYRDQIEEWEKTAEEAEAKGSPVPAVPTAPRDPRSNHWRPAGLWNAMMAPITRYTIAGIIWYQGEANAAYAYRYRKDFASMIEQWRASWKEGDLPFLFVQLANYNPPKLPADAWAVLRESQAKALDLPETGMAVAIDIGEPHNIHPKNKQEVGRRLALAAEAVAYGRKVEYSGPAFASVRLQNDTLRVLFTHANGGLVARGGPPTGFQIAGDDRKFVDARAKIEGKTVVLSSPQVRAPKAARYDWANDPDGNLYNKAGLPAAPFRTDDWPVFSQGEVRKEVP